MENLENQSQIENDFSSILENIGAQNQDKNMATKTVNSVQIEPKMEIKSMENVTSEKQVILNCDQSQNEEKLLRIIDALPNGDQVAINEMYLQSSNVLDYENQRISIQKNLIRKVLRRKYDHNLAIKLGRYLIDKINKNEGINASIKLRDLASEKLVVDFEYEFENDDLDSNLYPKYANKS